MAIIDGINPGSNLNKCSNHWQNCPVPALLSLKASTGLALSESSNRVVEIFSLVCNHLQLPVNQVSTVHDATSSIIGIRLPILNVHLV